MRGQAIVAGARDLLVFVIKAILFPLTWMWAFKIAKRHSDADPGAMRKVVIAVIVGLIAAPGIGYMVYDYQEDARAGMYETMEGRLSTTYGASAHSDQSAAADAAAGVIGVLQTALSDAQDELSVARAALDAADTVEEADAARLVFDDAVAKVADLEKNLILTQITLDQTQRWSERLADEDAFFKSIHDEILAQDDAALRAAAARRADAQAAAITPEAAALIDAEKAMDSAAMARADALALQRTYELLDEGRGLSSEESAAYEAAKAEYVDANAAYNAARDARSSALAAVNGPLPVPEDVHDTTVVLKGTHYWLGIKDNAEAQMAGWMNYMIFPGLIGVFYAPLFFALGSIMARAWDRSESVGFKPYPGASMGLFLFFGAFGWPSLLFAAWGLWDIDVRSKEGQISL